MHPRCLKPYECVVKIEQIQCVMTVDSGAEVTLVPKELVPSYCFTWDEQPVKGVYEMGNQRIGDKILVQIQVHGEMRDVTALAIPGAQVSWVGALCLVPTVREDRPLMCELGEYRESLPEERLHYLPPSEGPGGMKGVVWPLCG